MLKGEACDKNLEGDELAYKKGPNLDVRKRCRVLPVRVEVATQRLRWMQQVLADTNNGIA